MRGLSRRMADFLALVLMFSPVCAALVMLVAVAGCTRTVVEDRPQRVAVPVPQPCAGERPDPVTPLKAEVPDAEWHGLDPRQKAARVGRKGLELRAYGEQLNAATAACPESEVSQ